MSVGYNLTRRWARNNVRAKSLAPLPARGRSSRQKVITGGDPKSSLQQFTGWPMTRADNDIYPDIASILSEAPPIGEAQMVMSAKITPESDACRFTCDSVKGAGEKSWLAPGAKVNSSLMDLLVELRN